jgi:hypothetical protein
MRNVPLTLVHVLPTVRMWPEVLTPPEIAQWYKFQVHGFMSDARRTAG